MESNVLIQDIKAWIKLNNWNTHHEVLQDSTLIPDSLLNNLSVSIRSVALNEKGDQYTSTVSDLNSSSNSDLCSGVSDSSDLVSPHAIELRKDFRDTLRSQDKSEISITKSWNKTSAQSCINTRKSFLDEGLVQDVHLIKGDVRNAYALQSPNVANLLDGYFSILTNAIQDRVICSKNASRADNTILQHGNPQDSVLDPGFHNIVSLITRVATMNGLTIYSRDESAIHSLIRLSLKALKDLFNLASSGCLLIDSICVIRTLEEIVSSEFPFMHPMFADTHHTFKVIREQITVMFNHYKFHKKNEVKLASKDGWSDGQHSCFPTSCNSYYNTSRRVILESTHMSSKEKHNILWETLDFDLSQLNFEFSQSSDPVLLGIIYRFAPKMGTHAHSLQSTSIPKGTWSIQCRNAMGNLEELISPNELPRFQGTFNNNLVMIKPLSFSHRSDSIISLSPSQLMIRRKLSINPSIIGANLMLESSVLQGEFYKINLYRGEFEIPNSLTLGSKWCNLHKGSTCLLTFSNGDDGHSGNRLNSHKSMSIVPSMINIIKKSLFIYFMFYALSDLFNSNTFV